MRATGNEKYREQTANWAEPEAVQVESDADN
jgi:hypothetical protein